MDRLNSNSNHFLPESGEYATVVMQYKNRELGFCMKPEDMEHGLIPTIKALRYAVIEHADLIEENAK
jgi:hypothetical protein